MSFSLFDKPVGPWALLDDCAASPATPTSRLYTGLLREHRCAHPEALDATWAAVDRELRAGHAVVLLADYEWGAALHGVAAAPGALRFLVFACCERLSAAGCEAWLDAADAGAGATIGDLRASVGEAGFARAIARIHEAIRAGDSYQVNYSFRLDFAVDGDPLALYRRLRARQPVPYGAYLALAAGERPAHVLSCSPELFVAHRAGRLACRPMKGTARRAAQPEGDSEAARGLQDDAKNRAENLMIVDLLRNDLGRIARIGSVRVPALFTVEPYANVFQMTSTVEAELADEVDFPEILRALFPCGSITGAPKLSTMRLIAELESTPRGLYTGALGWIDPPAGGRSVGDFCLAVTIRTATLEAAPGGGWRGRLGVGAGIVIDSTAADEYAECALKARFLTGLKRAPNAVCPEPLPWTA